jgi:glycosyltransferase involved in cell wall biosynthesis
MERKMRILFVGSRILPFRHAGDKSFWLDLFDCLRGLGHTIHALSVTYDSPLPTAPSWCEFVRPIPVPNPLSGRYNPESRWLAATNNYVSKTVSFPRIWGALRRARASFRPDVIHFIDNYGPVLATVRRNRVAPVFTVSAPTYDRRAALYDSLLRLSFRPFDAIIPFSEAFAKRLGTIGVNSGRVDTIRWGIDPAALRPAEESERRASRARLGIASDRIVAIWTGFIQQTTWRDFEFAYRVGELLRTRTPDRFSFVFCFKPAHFRPDLLQRERPGVRIVGTATEFEDARRAADYLLSPIGGPRSTLAPPLSWLEALAMGLPIVSTPIPGIEEVIVPGSNGWVVRTPEEAADRIESDAASPERCQSMRTSARQSVMGRFSVDRAAHEYVRLWERLIERKRGRSG